MATGLNHLLQDSVLPCCLHMHLL